MKYTRRDMGDTISLLIQRVGDLINRVEELESTINEQRTELKQMKCSHNYGKKFIAEVKECEKEKEK